MPAMMMVPMMPAYSQTLLYPRRPPHHREEPHYFQLNGKKPFKPYVRGQRNEAYMATDQPENDGYL